MGNGVGENAPSSDQVHKAIASLAARVTQLEKSSVTTVSVGERSDLRPAMTATLVDLKALRTALATCSSEVDDVMKRCISLQEENSKLKYQIKHLKRSLSAAEDS